MAFSSLACPEANIDEIINKANQYDYQAVELRSYSRGEHVDPALNPKRREELRKKFAANNVDICCLAGYTRFEEKDKQQDQITKLKSLIRLASDLNIPYVRSFGGQIPLIKSAFNQVAALAADLEVKVLLETHDVLSRGEDIRKIFTELNSDLFGVVWDIKHTIKAGESLEQTISYLEDYIYHIHIKDWIVLPVKEEDHLVLLKAGKLPIDSLLTLLEDINYDGYLSVEWEKPWHPEIEDSDIALYQYAVKLNELRGE